MREIYQRRRDLVCNALAEIEVDVAAEGTIYVWAPVPAGHVGVVQMVLEESGVVVSPRRLVQHERRASSGSRSRCADERLRGGRRAPAREPRGMGCCCGVVPTQRDLMLQLALLEEVRDPEPPIRLSALFYEP